LDNLAVRINNNFATLPGVVVVTLVLMPVVGVVMVLNFG